MAFVLMFLLMDIISVIRNLAIIILVSLSGLLVLGLLGDSNLDESTT